MTGHLKKRRYGPWMLRAMKAVAKLRRLRGTHLDIFGYSAERRTERQLLRDYEALLDQLMTRLSPETHGLAVELAALSQQIRGFGHVKEANIERVQARERELLAALAGKADMPQAA